MTNVALITGASSGIGYAAALAFARDGTHVVVTARRMDRLDQLAAAVNVLPAPHGDILTMGADVRDAQAVQAAVDAALERFGRLDILVANAGVGHRGAIVDADWDDIDAVLATNIDGVLHTIRAGVPALRQSGGGHVIVISSVTATMTAPHTAYYAASKAFVSSLARSLRVELVADNIWVTDILLGRTQTEFSEKRLGASGRGGGVGPSSMPVDRAAEAIVRATKRRHKTMILRLVDRLIILANTFFPDLVARLVVRQYKVQ